MQHEARSWWSIMQQKDLVMQHEARSWWSVMQQKDLVMQHEACSWRSINYSSAINVVTKRRPLHRAGNITVQRRNAILEHKADQAAVSATLQTTGDQPFLSNGHNGCCGLVRGQHVQKLLHVIKLTVKIAVWFFCSVCIIYKCGRGPVKPCCRPTFPKIFIISQLIALICYLFINNTLKHLCCLNF